MNSYDEIPFVFSPRYWLARHVVFWIVHVFVFTFMFGNEINSFGIHFLVSATWAILFIIYIYPILYFFIPKYLLKGKYVQFVFIIIGWGVIGWFWNYVCRAFVFYPIAELLHFQIAGKILWAPVSFLTMMTMAGLASMIKLFKYWMKTQRDFLMEHKEKIDAELQLLKAQVHPHFLFNTLNNIYSFSLQNSPNTPQMIVKLSSLLSYMLYDCRAGEVLLEKEMDIMNNYIDLEKERYSNTLEVSVNIEGDLKNWYITPLLILPFLENAFKHGTSEQLDKPWLSMDISIKQKIMRCKIVNSKNEMTLEKRNGIGIQNVQKRLAYLYPDKHELKINDEGNFFVVSLMLELKPNPVMEVAGNNVPLVVK
jgi:two-component system, LytTR family, sensor histidine kinase AlgZ